MKKIVVVDDNKVFLETLKDFIEIQKNFRCITFSNSVDALRYVLDEKEVYAVVSDYEMPQMNGFELIEQIVGRLNITRIIVMSGHDTNYLKNIALKFGIDENEVEFLCKSNIINLMTLLN